MIVLKVYSDLFLSNTLFLFWVTKLTEVQVLIIISKDFTGLTIFVSPRGIEMLFFPKTDKFWFANFSEVGRYKFDWSSDYSFY